MNVQRDRELKPDAPHSDVFSTARCFYVVSQWNGKVLDVRGDEASAGASLIIYDRKPVVAANQVWYEDEVGLLRSKLNGYVLDTSCESAVTMIDEFTSYQGHNSAPVDLQCGAQRVKGPFAAGKRNFSTRPGCWFVVGDDLTGALHDL